jgi:hypothetical protein
VNGQFRADREQALFSRASTAGAEAEIRMLDVSLLREEKTGKKIPAGRRVESIFLEEDRGDMSMMLHRTRTVQ